MLFTAGFEDEDLESLPSELRSRIKSQTLPVVFGKPICILISAAYLANLNLQCLCNDPQVIVFVYLPEDGDDFYAGEVNLGKRIIKANELSLLKTVLEITSIKQAKKVAKLVKATRKCDNQDCPRAEKILENFSENEVVKMIGDERNYRMFRVFR